MAALFVTALDSVGILGIQYIDTSTFMALCHITRIMTCVFRVIFLGEYVPQIIDDPTYLLLLACAFLNLPSLLILLALYAGSIVDH